MQHTIYFICIQPAFVFLKKLEQVINFSEYVNLGASLICVFGNDRCVFSKHKDIVLWNYFLYVVDVGYEKDWAQYWFLRDPTFDKTLR